MDAESRTLSNQGQAWQMNQRILVLGTNNDEKLSVVNLLNNYSESSTLPSFVTTDTQTLDASKHLFIIGPRLEQVRSQKKEEKKRSNKCWTDDISLILLITHKDSMDEKFYDHFRFVILNIFHKQVPAICIVNECKRENDMYRWISQNQRFFISRNWHFKMVLALKRSHGSSKSIQKVWETIQEYWVRPSTISTDPHARDMSTERQQLHSTTTDKELLDQSIDQTHKNKIEDATHNDNANKRENNRKPPLFTPKNTSIAILKERCKQLDAYDSQNNCVLLMSGSLNPIHRSHVGNLEVVRQHLEQSDPRWNVLAGYLSPTHDAYIGSKLGKSAIPASDRCDLCELGIEEHNSITKGAHWIYVSRAESEYPRGFVDFGPVSEEFSRFLNATLSGPKKLLKHPLYVIYVCGLDHFNKCPDVQNLARKKNIKCAVIYRKGSDERRIRKLDASSNIIYIPLDSERQNLIDISSTEIRHRLENSLEGIHQLTYDCVIQRLKSTHYKFHNSLDNNLTDAFF